MNDTVRTGLNRVRLPISPSTLDINNYNNVLEKSQDLNGIIEKSPHLRLVDLNLKWGRICFMIFQIDFYYQ